MRAFAILLLPAFICFPVFHLPVLIGLPLFHFPAFTRFLLFQLPVRMRWIQAHVANSHSHIKTYRTLSVLLLTALHHGVL